MTTASEITSYFALPTQGQSNSTTAVYSPYNSMLSVMSLHSNCRGQKAVQHTQLKIHGSETSSVMYTLKVNLDMSLHISKRGIRSVGETGVACTSSFNSALSRSSQRTFIALTHAALKHVSDEYKHEAGKMYKENNNVHRCVWLSSVCPNLQSTCSRS